MLLPIRRLTHGYGLLFTAVLLLTGCTVQQPRPVVPPVAKNASWLLLPVINYSQTPQAGERAEAILETQLHAVGVKKLLLYSPVINRDDSLPLLDERKRLAQALVWARGQQADYAITGTIAEWRYKSGLDGEPAVGLSLKIIKLPDEQIVWSSSAARAGWSRESLAATAQMVINDLIRNVPFN